MTLYVQIPVTYEIHKFQKQPLGGVLQNRLPINQ